MTAGTCTLKFPGKMLNRGFWLYVWRVETPKGEYLYVGRTGDSSSCHAASPIQRMGQHLGNNVMGNALRRHLKTKGISAERCTGFRLVAHGPLFPEAKGKDKDENKKLHRKRRDKGAALGAKLAEALVASGYKMLNEVECKKPLDPKLWNEVCLAFAQHFPRINNVPEAQVA